MKKNCPLSVYFTALEREYLARLAEHCRRSDSEQVRWLVVDSFRRVFPEDQAHPSHKRRS